MRDGVERGCAVGAHVDRVLLAYITHVGGTEKAGLLVGDPFSVQDLSTLLLEQNVDILNLLHRQAVQPAIKGLAHVVADVGLKHAPSGEGARAPWDDHLGDLELFCKPDSMHWSGTAKSDQRKRSRIDALLNGDRSMEIGRAS